MTAVKKNLEDISALNKNFFNSLVDKKNKLTDEFLSFVSSILEEVSDPKRGLFSSLNCTYFRISVESFKQSACYDFIPSIFQLSILIIIIACLGFLASLFLVCTVLKSYRDDDLDNKNDNVKKEQPGEYEMTNNKI